VSAPAARADAGAADWTLIAKVVGAVAGGVGWVAVVGTAVLWIRFNDVWRRARGSRWSPSVRPSSS
jgi:hypothetical protein